MMLSLFLVPPAFAGGVPVPAIPKAKGTHCIRNTEWMRRNHMTLLMHEGDEAVHRGIRSKEETLPGCMSCHVSRLADGHYPSITSKKFFCNSCHGYVGVKIDCFSCHTNRPGPANPIAASGGGPGVAESGILRQIARARRIEGGAK